MFVLYEQSRQKEEKEVINIVFLSLIKGLDLPHENAACSGALNIT